MTEKTKRILASWDALTGPGAIPDIHALRHVGKQLRDLVAGEPTKTQGAI